MWISLLPIDKTPGPIPSELPDALRSDFDLDGVAQAPGTAFQRHVPVQSVVLAVDRGLSIEGDALLAHRILPTSGEFSIQYHLVGDIADRQVPEYARVVAALGLDAGALERDLRVLLDLQEVAGLQVIVAIVHPRIQAGRVEINFDRGVGWIGLVEDERALHTFKTTSDRRNHHVLSYKLDERVIWVKLPDIASSGFRLTLCRHVSTSLENKSFGFDLQRNELKKLTVPSASIISFTEISIGRKVLIVKDVFF